MKIVLTTSVLAVLLSIQCQHGAAFTTFHKTQTALDRRHVRLNPSSRLSASPVEKSGIVSESNPNGDASKRTKIRNKMSSLAKRMVPVARPIISKVYPQAIAEIITDATSSAIEEVHRIGQIRSSLAYTNIMEQEAIMEGETVVAMDTIALAKTQAADAFALAESAIEETEEALRKSKLALAKCREDVAKSIAIAEKSAIQANVSSQKATALAASATISASSSNLSDRLSGSSVSKSMGEDSVVADEKKLENRVPDAEHIEVTSTKDIGIVDESTESELELEESFDISSLDYDDVDYHLSEMAPPFIGEDQCLVPGEAVVRVEKAMENSRRIFAGIDILASVDDVWEVLTDYENLQQVVPNLVVNDVLQLYDGDKEAAEKFTINPDIRSEDQCNVLSKNMKGAKLYQIGGAKVVGINFSAQVTLEVREWPNGMPDFFHFDEDDYEGRSRTERAKLERKRKLERYHFPRPFAISKLPTKDISMQSIEDDDGEFRLYQGVWRMTPLPGCAPPGGAAMRLTYAVEISPRPYLPVAFVEGRISQDLCNNLRAIRDHVTK